MALKSLHNGRVYLLHGWAVDPDNEAKWVQVRQLLSDQGIESTFLGLPGLTTPLDEVWTLADYVSWVGQQLPEEPVILLGHSFGGQISIKFAAEYPERVKKLILVDSAGILDHRWQIDLKRRLFKLLAKIGKPIKNIAIARQLLYKLAREKDYFEAAPLLRETMSNVISTELWGELQQLVQPTLIIWGNQDKVTPIHLGQQMTELISESRFSIVDGARHSPQFTHPIEVATLVADFLGDEDV